MNRRSFLAASAAVCAVVPSAAAQASDFAAAAAYSAERRGVSLLVMRRGEAVFEDYSNEGGAERGWELASGTKSFTGVVAAAAIQDGLISSWDERCADTLTEWRNDDRRRITIRHLLSLTSGIEGGPIARPPTYADAIAQLAGAAPGERFAYGPTPFQVFGEIIRRKTNADPLAYLQRRILDPLDIQPARWRRGADGMPHLPSGAALTARDWARFGWFVMQGGEGRVDRAALAQCFEGSRANPGYGLSWWLLRDGLIPPGRNAGLEIDTALSARLGGVSMAAGAGNQRLYLLPALDLVVVRQATGILEALMRRDRGPRWSDAEFLRLLLTPA
jgi:CubicO group peptidase (beta-lactamase class C family)